MPKKREEPAQESEQLSELFRAHASFVWRALRRLGISEADAEDALQEVFLVVARRLDGYQERGAMRAWLFTIARQVASHVRRASTRRDRRHLALVMEPKQDDPQDAAERSQAARIVQDFLTSLDEPQATVFYLMEIEGLSAPEVSAALQVNLNTVYGRLRIARKRFEALVAELERRER